MLRELLAHQVATGALRNRRVCLRALRLQRHDRVYACRAARGQARGNDRQRKQEQRHSRARHRIERPHSEQRPGKKAAECGRPTTPSASPAQQSATVVPSNHARTSPAVAPSARRMPNSRVHCTTAYAMILGTRQLVFGPEVRRAVPRSNGSGLASSGAVGDPLALRSTRTLVLLDIEHGRVICRISKLVPVPK